MIEAKFSGLSYPVSDVIPIVSKKTDESDEIINWGLTAVDVLSFAAGGEAIKGIIVTARAEKWGKVLWEAFRLLQGPMRKGGLSGAVCPMAQVRPS